MSRSRFLSFFVPIKILNRFRIRGTSKKVPLIRISVKRNHFSRPKLTFFRLRGTFPLLTFCHHGNRESRDLIRFIFCNYNPARIIFLAYWQKSAVEVLTILTFLYTDRVRLRLVFDECLKRIILSEVIFFSLSTLFSYEADKMRLNNECDLSVFVCLSVRLSGCLSTVVHCHHRKHSLYKKYQYST